MIGVCGGASHSAQVSAITNVGIDIIVATPGRLLELIQENIVLFDRLSFLIIDEANHFLGDTMEENLQEIAEYTSSTKKQTLIFTSNINPSVEHFANLILNDPIYLSSHGPMEMVGLSENSKKYHVIFLHTYQKKIKILEVLRSIPKPPVVIFCNTTYSVEKVIRTLKEEQFHAAGIHTEKTQGYRHRVFQALKDGKLDVMVISDQIMKQSKWKFPPVEHVIFWDIPHNIQDFANRTTLSLPSHPMSLCTAFLTYDCKIATELKKLLKSEKQIIPKELEDTKTFGGEITKTPYGDIPTKAKFGK